MPNISASKDDLESIDVSHALWLMHINDCKPLQDNTGSNTEYEISMMFIIANLAKRSDL